MGFVYKLDLLGTESSYLHMITALYKSSHLFTVFDCCCSNSQWFMSQTHCKVAGPSHHSLSLYHLVVDWQENADSKGSLTVLDAYIATGIYFIMTLPSDGSLYNISVIPTFWLLGIMSHCFCLKGTHPEKPPCILVITLLQYDLRIMSVAAPVNGTTKPY
jgi:hypothetical protein